jgi:hypothetical protein
VSDSPGDEAADHAALLFVAAVVGAVQDEVAQDFNCSECGRVDMRGIFGIPASPMLGVPIRFGENVQQFIGPLLVSDVAICKRCRLEIGRRRERRSRPVS